MDGINRCSSEARYQLGASMGEECTSWDVARAGGSTVVEALVARQMGQQNTIVQADTHTSSQDWEDWGTPMVDGGAGKNKKSTRNKRRQRRKKKTTNVRGRDTTTARQGVITRQCGLQSSIVGGGHRGRPMSQRDTGTFHHKEVEPPRDKTQQHEV